MTSPVTKLYARFSFAHASNSPGIHSTSTTTLFSKWWTFSITL